MASLLISILLLKIIIQLLDLIPGSIINSILWAIYSRIPILNFPSTPQPDQNALKRDLLAARAEMASLSPQDDFARWARVRRKHDKLEASLESVSSQVSSQRTGFDRTCSGTRWMLTKGLWWGILTWGAFRGWVVFWVPGEWALPWFVLWLLKFPRAPYGAVGVQVWGMAVGAACEVLVGGSTMVLELRKATAMKEGGRAPLAGQDPAAAEAIKKAA